VVLPIFIITLIPDLPEDMRLWAALRRASGDVWTGCVYDVDHIIKVIDTGLSTLTKESG
jgi:hypothetical protein